MKKFILLFLSAFILLYFSLFDNFPIITGDSGTYINSGFTLTAPIDRPIFYGLFIRLSSLGASLWLTAFSQCIILAYVLIAFIKNTIPSIKDAHILAIMIFVSFFTIGGWYAGQLMPDIFVSIMTLSIANYLLFQNNKKQNALLLCFIFCSVLTHNSNFVTFTLFCVLCSIIIFFKRSLLIFSNKLISLFILALICWTTLFTSNWMTGQGFTSSTSSHVFIMGKLVESGVLKIYLDKACPVRDYKICAHKDKLPAAAFSFLWDSDSPLQKEGGWEVNKEEYTTIIKDILSRPKYYPLLAYKSAEATARQLTHYEIDGNYILPWYKFDEDSAPYKSVEKYFPHELNQLINSKLNNKTIDIPFLDNLFFLAIIISSVTVLLLSPFLQRTDQLTYISFALFAILIILNAFTTATLANVLPRLNSRIIWLLPFLNIVYVFKIIKPMVDSYRSKNIEIP